MSYVGFKLGEWVICAVTLYERQNLGLGWDTWTAIDLRNEVTGENKIETIDGWSPDDLSKWINQHTVHPTPESIMKEFVSSRDLLRTTYEQYKAGEVDIDTLKAVSDHHHEMRRIKALYRRFCSDEVLIELGLQPNSIYYKPEK